MGSFDNAIWRSPEQLNLLLVCLIWLVALICPLPYLVSDCTFRDGGGGVVVCGCDGRDGYGGSALGKPYQH